MFSAHVVIQVHFQRKHLTTGITLELLLLGVLHHDVPLQLEHSHKLLTAVGAGVL